MRNKSVVGWWCVWKGCRDGVVSSAASKSWKEAGMAGADNPNRVSRLNKDPFVLGTSFDPPDVFAHPEQ